MALPCGGSSFRKVGLWRSWERASMAWKRSPVRSRPGPPSSITYDSPYLYKASALSRASWDRPRHALVRTRHFALVEKITLPSPTKAR